MTEIKIVVDKPLNKNFKLVNPSMLLGETTNQPNSWPLHDVSGKIKSKKNILFTSKLIES